MLRDQWQNLEAGDILLGDKAYCSYHDSAELPKRGIDTVCTPGIRKPTPRNQAVQVLGDNDWLVRWPLPKRTHKSAYSAPARVQLTDSLLTRQIYVRVNTAGFRTQGFLKALLQQLVEVIAGKRLMQRPGQREPRAVINTTTINSHTDSPAS